MLLPKLMGEEPRDPNQAQCPNNFGQVLCELGGDCTHNTKGTTLSDDENWAFNEGVKRICIYFTVYLGPLLKVVLDGALIQAPRDNVLAVLGPPQAGDLLAAPRDTSAWSRNICMMPCTMNLGRELPMFAAVQHSWRYLMTVSRMTTAAWPGMVALPGFPKMLYPFSADWHQLGQKQNSSFQCPGWQVEMPGEIWCSKTCGAMHSSASASPVGLIRACNTTRLAVPDDHLAILAASCYMQSDSQGVLFIVLSDM